MTMLQISFINFMHMAASMRETRTVCKNNSAARLIEN